MKAFLWILAIGGVFFFATYLFRDNIRRALLPNRIILQTKGKARPDDTRIDWTAEGRTDTLAVYIKGKETGAVFEAIGLNTFMLYYQGQLVAHFEQFKSNAVQAHTYTFLLEQKGDSIYTDLDIFGRDANR